MSAAEQEVHMKTIAITLTGNPGPLAEVRQQLEKQGIIVDVVNDHCQVAHIVLDDEKNVPAP